MCLCLSVSIDEGFQALWRLLKAFYVYPSADRSALAAAVYGDEPSAQRNAVYPRASLASSYKANGVSRTEIEESLQAIETALLTGCTWDALNTAKLCGLWDVALMISASMNR